MTNRQLAETLGVSPAAFSLIINHKPGVSDLTRQRVLKELKDMGYEHLIKKTPVSFSNHLCFIIFKCHGEILDVHPFFLLLMETIENQARLYGYNILFYTIDKRRGAEEQIQHLNELDCKGAILFATEMQEEDMELFLNLELPLVALDNAFSLLSCNTIAINNEMGTFQAVKHLVQTGHRRIGYLKSTIRISSFEERQKGYEDALNYFGLSFAPSDILSVHYAEEGSFRDLKNYLENHPAPSLPTAFVCDDDTIAAGALRAFREYGYGIPEDISIIGFNDRPTSEISDPPLTSVNVSADALASEAVDELIRLIDSNGSSSLRSRKLRIGTTLTIRSSTASP